MDYDQLSYDLQHASSVKLLKADHAALIVSFLHHQFKQEQRVSIPLAELAQQLEGYLDIMREHEPGRYPRTAQAYINEWADESHRFIRISALGNSDKPAVELTADTERAIGWLEEMHGQSFVGTESRFLLVVQMLRDILQRSTEDPAIRLEQLEQQRDLLQQQIDVLNETGKVDDRYTDIQIKERFLEASTMARQLLRDFRLVEDRFRAIARQVQDDQLQPDAHKGTLVEYVLDADEQLKTSDQGRSFYTFWEFLMAPSQQEELYAILREIVELPEIQEVAAPGQVLQRLPAYLINAGEKVVQSNHRLSEQLRRILDEQAQAESRRVRELVARIKHDARHGIGKVPEDITFLDLEGVPAVNLVMERSLWEPAETIAFDEQPVHAGEIELDTIDLTYLYKQFVVDESTLRNRIEQILDRQPQATLVDILDFFPVEKGLPEILTYCEIATKDPRHLIDPAVKETIPLSRLSDGTHSERVLLLPRVLFRREADEK